MAAGKLNELVSIQQRSGRQDEIGQPIDEWTDVATVWADIRHQSGLETIKAGAETSIVRTSIRIRYRDGVTAGMRVKHKATMFDIKAVLPDAGKKRFVDLVCEVIQ